MEQDFAKRLLAITEGCRDDMHEPDEQDIRARVVGDHLDNAYGDHIGAEQIKLGCQEFVVVLERFFPGNKEHKTEVRVEVFNLASLIALARRGASQAA